MTLAPGLHHDVPFEDYLKIDAASQSRLKKGLQSMAHVKADIDNPRAPTAAMDKGTLAHAGQLEPLEIPKRYVVMPPFENDPENMTSGKIPRKPKAPKQTAYYAQKVAEFTKANADKKIVTQSDYDDMLGMVTAIHDHPIAHRFFDRGGDREVTAIWDDAETGLRCKCRADALLVDEWPSMGDLKTTQDASLNAFTRTIANLLYYIQAAWYVDGINAAGGPVCNFVVIAVESTAPYGVNVFDLGDDWLRLGRIEYRRLLRLYKRCVDSGEWPGYDPQIKSPAVPRWLLQQYGSEVAA